MLKRISLHSALAVSLMAVMATGAIAQPNAKPNGKPRPATIFDLDAAPSEDAAQEPQAPQGAQGQPEARASRLQAPGASAYTNADANGAPELEPITAEIRSRLTGVLSDARGTHPDDAAGLAAFYNGRNSTPIWTDKNGLNLRASKAMIEIRRAGDWGLDASAFALPEPDRAEPSPGDLAEADIKLSLAVLKYARHARGGRIDYSEATDLIDERSNVYEPKSVLQAVTVADSADAFLRSLHPKHEQFHRLREALLRIDRATSSAPLDSGRPDRDRARGEKRLTSSPDDERKRIIANMERWRLMPEDLGDFYVWNSIPEQYTRVFDHGKIVLKEKIVVGKPKTPTPMFSAKMQFVIFHPEWGVPNSIKLNELGPKLREASGGGYDDEGDSGPSWFGRRGGGSSQVLDRMGLRVTLEGREVDPDSVDWGSVDIRRFQFIQGPGEHNVLGVVKFRFPNKHDVYMHDTPDRKLFSSAQRTFSHGCMRTQNPVHLAEVVLAHDHAWPSDYVQRLLVEEGKPKEIKLTNPVPVHVTYFTMDVDEDGKLRSLPDVYGVDKLVTAALDGQPLRFNLKSQTQTLADAASRNADPRDGNDGYDREPRSRLREPDSRYGRRRSGDWGDGGDEEDTWSSGRWNRLDGLFGR